MGGRDVHFTDGSVVKDVDAVIAATGFKVDIPALKEEEMRNKYRLPRHLWNHMVHVDEKDFFLVGFCRPQQINLITCCEMQARTMAQIVSGNKQFPSDEQMKMQINDTIEHMKLTFERGYKALVDFIPFNDGMAKFIGCEPNYLKYFFTDFKMWVPMVYAPIQPCQYRLVGPGANPKLARETILKSPYYQWPKERIARDFNCSMLLLISGFCDLFGIGSKHMRIQGQLRSIFKLFAFCYLWAVGSAVYHGYKSVYIPMSFLVMVYGKQIHKIITQSESFLKDEKMPFVMQAAHAKAMYKKTN